MGDIVFGIAIAIAGVFLIASSLKKLKERRELQRSINYPTLPLPSPLPPPPLPIQGRQSTMTYAVPMSYLNTSQIYSGVVFSSSLQWNQNQNTTLMPPYSDFRGAAFDNSGGNGYLSPNFRSGGTVLQKFPNRKEEDNEKTEEEKQAEKERGLIF